MSMELDEGLASAKKVNRAFQGVLVRNDVTKLNIQASIMHFVYVLESANRQHWYFGVTNDIKRRLSEHNSGESTHTSKYRPWTLRICVTFKNRLNAEEFERYLKSHSGRAFMSKHFSQ